MPAQRRDAAPTFLFGFKITSGDLALDYKDATAFFKSVSGLKVQQDIQDVTEGGVSSFTRKVQGVFKWPNLVLTQGFTGDPKMWKYKMKPMRVDGVIVQLGHKLEPLCKWQFHNAYPVKWTGPDFDTGKNELSIEILELAHEGLVMNPEAEKSAEPAT
jgi:phage tail-like protein